MQSLNSLYEIRHTYQQSQLYIQSNIQRCVRQTQQNSVFIIVLGRHVSILIESSSGPSKKIDPYLKCV